MARCLKKSRGISCNLGWLGVGITMPKSMVRLSAGREDMTDEAQALCFVAGANSIFYGPKLLTTPNRAHDKDMRLLERLGMIPME